MDNSSLSGTGSGNFRSIVGKCENPITLDLADTSVLLNSLKDPADQDELMLAITESMRINNSTLACGGFLENRKKLFESLGTHHVEQERFVHLGVDIVPLSSDGTEIHLPLPGKVIETGYESGDGNYGGYVLIRHEKFYTFYGHLDKDHVVLPNHQLNAGEVIGKLGNSTVNGGYFPHLHLQVITELGLNEGYKLIGYCKLNQTGTIQERVLDPTSVII